jgi:Zn-dependent protease with chaperone function
MIAHETVPPQSPLRVERWQTETPLLVLVILAALAIWLLLAFSIIGLIYAVLIGLLLFVSHLAFIAHLRGSAVRLGPGQLPELHRRVEELAERIGLRRAPVAYVMQAGGVLNALATRFFATNFIVLFSDLLDACGENTQARDMIIGHELGHLKAGHLRWRWFLMPGFFVPFLGSAYSRAREYTCDRYGAAVCDDRMAALRGLSILAAGGRLGPRIDLRSLAKQQEDFNSTWMTVGRWLATHPPLAHRVAALEPSLAEGVRIGAWGPIGALALLGGIWLVPALVMAVAFAKLVPAWTARMAEIQRQAASAGDASTADGDPVDAAAAIDPERAREQARSEIQALVVLVEEYRGQTGHLPADAGAVYGAWRSSRAGRAEPVDPFDGHWYGYQVSGEAFQIWSAGPDGDDPADDVFYESRVGHFR